MKKLLGLVPLFALTIMFVQCTGNSKRVNIVAMESHKTTHIQYDSIISMERLKEMDTERDSLLRLLKLSKALMINYQKIFVRQQYKKIEYG